MSDIPETSMGGVLRITIKHRLPQAKAREILEDTLTRLAGAAPQLLRASGGWKVEWKVEASMNGIIEDPPFCRGTGNTGSGPTNV